MMWIKLWAVTTAVLMCCCCSIGCAARERYQVLKVGVTLFNQSLDPYDVNDGGNMVRYLLDPAIAAPEGVSSTYEVRVSYLGSPPASYTLTLLRVSSAMLAGGSDVNRRNAPSTRRVLLDTERVVFRVADIAALPLLGESDAEGGDDDAYVVQVESRPWGRRRDGRTFLPRGEGTVFFNIKLEPMVFGVPQTMLPVLLTGIVVVLMCVFCLAPRVTRWLEPPVGPSSPEHRHSKDE